MSNFDDNTEFDDANPPEESNNRTFLLVAGILGGLVFLALLCLVGYFVLANNTTQQNDATAQAQATPLRGIQNIEHQGGRREPGQPPRRHQVLTPFLRPVRTPRRQQWPGAPSPAS